MIESKAATRWNVYVRSDLAVVGTNPESADMSNPRGEIIRERFYMVASNAYGDAFAWGWYESPEEAEAAYPLLAPPVEFWAATYPVYGSPAYEDYGAADQIAWEKEEDVRPRHWLTGSGTWVPVSL